MELLFQSGQYKLYMDERNKIKLMKKDSAGYEWLIPLDSETQTFMKSILPVLNANYNKNRLKYLDELGA